VGLSFISNPTHSQEREGINVHLSMVKNKPGIL
jgi:hypothetical protein